MKFLFNDASFCFETLRATGFALEGAADLADVLVTAANIPVGDEAAWHREWKKTAQRIHGIAKDCLAKGHRVSAREAFLRASNYYRVAEFYLRANPKNEPDVIALSRASRETFLEAGKLLDGPFEEVSIPYEGTTLPAYFFQVDNSGKPRPTVIYNNGFDSTREEAYGVIAGAALRRGYNVLAFDGPGQGTPIREADLFFRPDWEKVMTPVLDYAVSRKEVDKDKIALFGYSLGAFQVARAAAFDSRPAAIILDDGMYDFFDACTLAMPPFMVEWIREKKDDSFIPLAQLLMKKETGFRWLLQNGVWTFGLKTPPEFLRATLEYTLKGIAQNIKCATLILEAEEDVFLQGQADRVAADLKCPHTHLKLTTAEGASEHCHEGALVRANQVIFDWLDETLS